CPAERSRVLWITTALNRATRHAAQFGETSPYYLRAPQTDKTTKKPFCRAERVTCWTRNSWSFSGEVFHRVPGARREQSKYVGQRAQVGKDARKTRPSAPRARRFVSPRTPS